MSSEVDVSKLINFVLRDTGMHVNIVIGIAYVSQLVVVVVDGWGAEVLQDTTETNLISCKAIFGGLTWFVLSQLGEPSSTRRSEDGETFWLNLFSWTRLFDLA